MQKLWPKKAFSGDEIEKRLDSSYLIQFFPSQKCTKMKFKSMIELALLESKVMKWILIT